MLFAGPAGYDAGRSRNSFRGGAMTSAYLMPKYSLYLSKRCPSWNAHASTTSCIPSNISPQFWWGMSCEISSRNVPVIFRPSALGTIRLPVDAEAPAVFLRPIPVAAGAMIPGTVTAAAAAAVFLMKVLLPYECLS